LSNKNLTLNELLDDPLYFPFELISGRKIAYLRISEDTFKKSRFLDKRIHLDGEREVLYANSIEVANSLRDLKINVKRDLIHIFHISHVGSTFISKLLESSNETRVLREPNIFRDFTKEYLEINNFSSEYQKNELDSLLNGILKSIANSEQSKLVIKHTSGNLSLPIGHNNIENINQKEILLHTNLKEFLSHSITSSGLRGDAEGNVKTRLRYLNKLCLSNSFNLYDLSPLQKSSLIWMVEFSRMLSRKISNENALIINFDYDFKENNKEETIHKVIEYIFDGDTNNLDEIMNSKEWNLNPKNGKAYSFHEREQAIFNNYLLSKTEIKKVLNWVESICKEEPYLMPLINYIQS